MRSLELLNDYEHFTSYFQSLEAAVDRPQLVDLEDILDLLPEEITHELY